MNIYKIVIKLQMFFYCMDLNCVGIITEKGIIFCEKHNKYNVKKLKHEIKQVDNSIIKQLIKDEID